MCERAGKREPGQVMAKDLFIQSGIKSLTNHHAFAEVAMCPILYFFYLNGCQRILSFFEVSHYFKINNLVKCQVLVHITCKNAKIWDYKIMRKLLARSHVRTSKSCSFGGPWMPSRGGMEIPVSTDIVLLILFCLNDRLILYYLLKGLWISWSWRPRIDTWTNN